MISNEIRHFTINRILLLAVGLWPYNRSNFALFQMILFLSIVISFIVFQLTTFITMDLSFNLVINVISSTLSFMTVVISYVSFWINFQNVKLLFEYLEHFYNELKDENEIAIIKRYESNARRFMIYILLVVTCALLYVFTQPLWLYVSEIFLFTNSSRSSKLLYVKTEYFVDPEEYLFLILLHMNAAVFIGMIILVATGSIIIVYVTWANGIFSIASYRMKEALSSSMLKDISMKQDIMIRRKIIYAVDSHRKAMQFLELMASSFEGFLLIFSAILVTGVSFDLYGVMIFMQDILKAIPLLLSAVAHIFCMFIGNYAGQEIIDHNNHIFSTVYSVKWYKAPLRVQKLILFLLQRGNKVFKISVGGIVTSSLDGFAKMVNISISYFTVMYSIRQ